jgi:hypothetical protein
MDTFKLFFLNEERSYLGRRVGDVLTSMQELQDDLPNLGSRHLTRLAEDIINQIRKIIHSRWEPKNFKYLTELQKIAVAINKTIDERGDLKTILPAATQAMQDLSSKLGVKINAIQSPEEIGGENISMQDFQLTGNGPMPKQEQDPNSQPQGNQQSMMPPQ